MRAGESEANGLDGVRSLDSARSIYRPECSAKAAQTPPGGAGDDAKRLGDFPAGGVQEVPNGAVACLDGCIVGCDGRLEAARRPSLLLQFSGQRSGPALKVGDCRLMGFNDRLECALRRLPLIPLHRRDGGPTLEIEDRPAAGCGCAIQFMRPSPKVLETEPPRFEAKKPAGAKRLPESELGQ